MNKFSKREHGCPACLVVCAKDMKVDFKFLVNSFSLAIALEMKHGGKGILVSRSLPSSIWNLEAN
jgi:hypothetical protein